MALFESYERRINQINETLNKYGISSLEEAEKICKDKGIDVIDIVKGIQPICFENAGWAYLVGAAIAIKKGIKVAADAAETIGCSGMTHSAAMASEILVGKTILEALNTDLVCDAINTAMRELFLQIVYGRSQSAFSEDGLVVGAGLEDLGKGLRSQVGTMYATLAKGPRYLEMAEGYVTRVAVSDDDEIIGYEFVKLGVMMENIKKGMSADEALKKATGTYGRFDDAAKYIDPRTE